MTKYQAKSYKTRVEIDLQYQGLIPDPCQLTWRSLNLSLSDHSPLNSMSNLMFDQPLHQPKKLFALAERKDAPF